MNDTTAAADHPNGPLGKGAGWKGGGGEWKAQTQKLRSINCELSAMNWGGGGGGGHGHIN